MEAMAASKELKNLMEKSAEARGKDIVNRRLQICEQQMSAQKAPKSSNGNVMGQGAEIENNQSDIISRDLVEKLRLFLARRYPRLDGDEQLTYCEQDVVPECFDEDQVDGALENTDYLVGFKANKCRKLQFPTWYTA